ncbi:hypothetical protein LAB52_06160 [Lactobacillus amylovorus GRL1118]|nr:hypothetical protein LAB52_06160 [Lactobacillus amylovorus GRL1118]
MAIILLILIAIIIWLLIKIYDYKKIIPNYLNKITN